MKFMNLSPTADLYSKLQSHLTILNKNMLYVTNVLDNVLKICKDIQSDNNLKKQVNDYFDKDETSHQTELDEQ